MDANYEARMDHELYDEWMKANDPNYEPSGSSSSGSHDRSGDNASGESWESGSGSDAEGADDKAVNAESDDLEGDLEFNRSISK